MKYILRFLILTLLVPVVILWFVGLLMLRIFIELPYSVVRFIITGSFFPYEDADDNDIEDAYNWFWISSMDKIFEKAEIID